MFHTDKSRSFLTRATRHVEAPALLPPQLSEFGHEAFSSNELQTLARWLQEPTWPRDSLNIYSLEGYLTALLVWPVASQPGAWLPPIWNEAGWRVRPPIDTTQRYAEFLELAVGFLRRIDQGLLHAPAVFESSVHLAFGHDATDLGERIRHWAQGFGRGCRQGVQTLTAPTIEVREAIRVIAALATDQRYLSSDDMHRAGINLTLAVLALANTRASRGPLGALPKRAATAAPKDDADLPDRGRHE